MSLFDKNALVSTNLVGALVEILQLVNQAESAIVPAIGETKPDRVKFILDDGILAINAQIPCTVALVNGKLTVTAVDYIPLTLAQQVGQSPDNPYIVDITALPYTANITNPIAYNNFWIKVNNPSGLSINLTSSITIGTILLDTTPLTLPSTELEFLGNCVADGTSFSIDFS